MSKIIKRIILKVYLESAELVLEDKSFNRSSLALEFRASTSILTLLGTGPKESINFGGGSGETGSRGGDNNLCGGDSTRRERESDLIGGLSGRLSGESNLLKGESARLGGEPVRIQGEFTPLRGKDSGFLSGETECLLDLS